MTSWPEHLIEFARFLESFNKESERGLVLVAASQIDIILKKSIEAYLVQCSGADGLFEGPNAPLGGLSAKIHLANALGLISNCEASECNLVRKIRNRFAHEVHVDFEDQSVTRLCERLTYKAPSYSDGDDGVDVELGPRAKFTTAAVSLILNLTNRPAYAAQKRLQAKEWPY